MSFLSRYPVNSVDTEQLWVWEYETDEGPHDLFMDINEEIRFRIIDEEFVDLTPEGPAPPPVDGEPVLPVENKRSPYTVSASRHAFVLFLSSNLFCLKDFLFPVRTQRHFNVYTNVMDVL